MSLIDIVQIKYYVFKHKLQAHTDLCEHSMGTSNYIYMLMCIPMATYLYIYIKRVRAFINKYTYAGIDTSEIQ